MDQDQEQEQDESQHEELTASLSSHAAEHDPKAEAHGGGKGGTSNGGKAPGEVTPGLPEAAEKGANTGAAPIGDIDSKVSDAKHKEWEKKEADRKEEQKERITGRQKKFFGLMDRSDWTAKELAKLAEGGGQAVLVALNGRKPKQGIDLLKKANTWLPMLNKLPKGLTPEACTAVDQLCEDGVFVINELMILFEKRFRHAALDVSSGANNAKDWNIKTMETVWRQLSKLPPGDVTLSTAITTFRAIAGGGAFGPSWESPDTVNTVDIGQDNGDPEHLEHTVRHEIGHGVHSQLQSQINPWLQNDMQFWFTDDWNAWITELGGYPDKFLNPDTGKEQTVTTAWQDFLKKLVVDFTGSGGWDPTKATPDAATTPAGKAAWAAMPAAVKNACAQSTSHWYQNYQSFQAKSGKRFFLNHYYHRPFTIGSGAMQAIAATNESYTAMSEKEFFANCYAEYFADPKGVKDHSRWGGSLPGNVKSFMKEVVLERNPYDKFKKKEKADKENLKK